MATYTIQDFQMIDCYKCGVTFGLPNILYSTARDAGRDHPFWCPNGHRQSYVKSRVTELEEELATARKQITIEFNSSLDQMLRARKAERLVRRLKKAAKK